MADKIKSLVSIFVGSPATGITNPVTITVTDSLTESVISVFSDPAGSEPLGNPFLSSAEVIEFYCDPGLIDIDVDDRQSNTTYTNIRVGLSVDQFDIVGANELSGGIDKILIYKQEEKTFLHDLIQSINGAE